MNIITRNSRQESGVALALTLVLMALIVIVVIAYLGNTRIDRATSVTYSSRLRAQTIAQSGLASAIHLLRDNTRYGNYITAMPPTTLAPVPRLTEVYRPGVSVADLSANPSDYLRLDNAVGEILSSRASTGITPLLPVDPRPPPRSIPSVGPFTIADPGFTNADSYDFNQIVRLGTSNSGRLVNSDNQPAFGQWVRVRNSLGTLIGRYAFLIEDESMKVNVNVAGNNLGAGSSHLRVNDLILPAPAPTPTSQIQEIDPAAILPTAANRTTADNTLAGLGSAGRRLSSRSTLGLLNEWSDTFPDYAHIATVFSRDDNTTARGWQRLDLNALVTAAADNAAKSAAAHRISDWIRDAWTGSTPLANLQEHQLFGNERLRLQLAANIVDYIDGDNVSTDLGDIVPDGFTSAIPVIGIEKNPHLGSIFILYEASGRAGNTATMRMRMRFNFVNLFEVSLNLQQLVSRIEVQGIPVILKKGLVVFDHESQTYSIPVTSLRAVSRTGYDIPAGVDGTIGSGAWSFDTDWLVTGETVTFSTQAGNPIFESGQVQVRVFGPGDVRLDVTAAVTTDTPSTGYRRSGSISVGDFLLDSDTQARTVEAIYLQERVISGTSVTQNFGDPRFRPDLLNERWRRSNLTDDQALSDRVDTVDSNPRVYAVDWYDYAGNRPLVFLRNGPMLSVGELGNISACEYPWRTLYTQYPERLSNAGNATASSEIATRRRAALDYVLMDLFRTEGSATRTGSGNINTQQQFGAQQRTLAASFLGVPVGTQTLAQIAVDRITSSTGASSLSTVTDRRLSVGPPPDNNPLRPFFQIGELASVLNRLVNTSLGGTSTTGSPGRSTVTYSLLRNSATTTTEGNANYQRDMQVEQLFRKVSNSITTRGNVFRALYVGQAIRDINKNGQVDGQQEIAAEYLGEAFVERQSTFQADTTLSADVVKTSDSSYRVIADRVVTE